MPPDKQGVSVSETAVCDAAVRTIREGATVDGAVYPEGDVMAGLVRNKLLKTAGIEPDGLIISHVEKPVEEDDDVEQVVPKPSILPPFLGKRCEGMVSDRNSGYCSGSEEVKDIATAHGNGRAVAVYELMQGMVDFGKGNLPAPRIWIEYQNGDKIPYQGRDIRSEDPGNPIVAIEFMNGGRGLPPEYAVINKSDRESAPSCGDYKLSKYGKGLTLALAYFKSIGVNVRISSHSEGQVWAGKMRLLPTETGRENVLNLQWKWGGLVQDGSAVTSVRIEKPRDGTIPDDIISGVSSASELFLYANPKYPEAVLVDRDECVVSGAELSFEVDKGRVVCLEGVLDKRQDGSWRHIYVDGLLVPISKDDDKDKRRSILPWAFHGLGDDDPKAKTRYQLLRVARSHNSTSYDADHISAPVLVAVQMIEDKEILRRLFECAVSEPEVRFLEFPEDQWYSSLLKMKSRETARLVREIWAEKYGEDAVLAFSKEQVELYRSHAGHDKNVVLIPCGLAKFLERCEVPTVEKELRKLDVKKMENLNNLYVPFAGSDNRLDILMDYVARIDGAVALVEVSGKKQMVFAIPKVIKDENVFNGQTVGNEGVVVRTAAVVAKAAKSDCSIFVIEGDSVYEVNILVSEVSSGIFKTIVEISPPYTRSKKPQYKGCKDGTYVVFSGGDVESFDIGGVNEYLEEKKKEREAMRKQMPSRKKEVPDVPTPESTSRENIGQIRIYEEEDRADSEPHPESKLPSNTYYREKVGTQFVYDEPRPGEKEGEGYWSNKYHWELVSDLLYEVPEKYESAHVICGLNSAETYLDVPSGCKIFAISASDDASVKLYKDVRTGTYRVTGLASKFVYYTCKSEMPYEVIPPTDDESADFLNGGDFRRLNPDWREFITGIMNGPALTTEDKVEELLVEKWRKTFVYSKKYSKNGQVKGADLEEIAARILNTNSGICNICATGFALLLRACGVPSRVVCGYWKQTDSHGGRHAWVEYFDGGTWKVLDPGLFVSSDDFDKVEGKTINEAFAELSRSLKMSEDQVAALLEERDGLVASVDALTADKTALQVENAELSDVLAGSRVGFQRLLDGAPWMVGREKFRALVRKELKKCLGEKETTPK